MTNYNSTSIIQMSERDHVRKAPGMYIGSTEDPTRLLDEVLDNALDEVQHSKKCDRIAVSIDTKRNTFVVIDNGRGMPFNQNLSIEKDPPVLACTHMRTSGKFYKSKTGSAYKIAAGLHGVGLTAVNFLSDQLVIDIIRDNKHAIYKFDYNGKIDRSEEKLQSNKNPFSTKIMVKPSSKHFKNLTINIKHIEERLRIACSEYPHLNSVLVVDDKKKIIKGTQTELILDYLGNVTHWISLEENNNPESYFIKFGWDKEDSSTSSKTLSVVNLIRVLDGSHLNRFYKALRTVFFEFSKKYKYEFEPDDCLRCLRVYMNLKLCETSFEAQIKVRLGKDTNLSIMDSLEDKLRSYLKKNEDFLKDLLNRFQSYRNSLKGKKVLITGNSKRVSSEFTKLNDCTMEEGELLIGEGDSAVGGIIQVRDPKKHAILPLRGVIPNAFLQKDHLKNVEIREILQALGCGIGKEFNINNLRYKKIILAADADPAGQFITVLLIGLFISVTPELIKQGKIYVCQTPLFGYGRGSEFVPLWTEEELQKRIQSGKEFRRFKGLGEFNPNELKRFTLDEDSRKLIQLEWSSNISDIINLYSTSTEKRNLMMKKV